MQRAVVMFARKPLLQSVPRSGRTRRNVLARLRDDITILKTIGFDHATIGTVLRISSEDVRALSPKINRPASQISLTRHAVTILLNGKHANVGGRTRAIRAKNLLKIVAAYTYEDLLDEPGVGAATASTIQLWLEERGARLRSPIVS